MAAANMKDIKRRIKSVQSTMQITKAMELVASSKLRHAKERSEQARPFFNTLYQTISDIAATNRDLSSVYTSKKPGNSPLYIVIAGDRGLAGGYNSGVLKLAESELNGKQNASVITIGRKSSEFFQKRGYNITASYDNVSENLSESDVNEITEIILKSFRERKSDSVFIVYTNFVSVLSQLPSCMKVLPLEVSERGNAPTEITEYDPSPEAVFDRIIPYYVGGILYGAVAESFASEQGARRTAMENASDNAKEMIDTLSLKYNRARQGAITQEITEIVAGAGALE